jgi:tetratricopeptide (TPR) repeat protein
MPEELQLPKLAKPPRLRLSQGKEDKDGKEGEASAPPGGNVYFAASDHGSDTEDLTKLLKPSAIKLMVKPKPGTALPHAPVASASTQDVPEGSLADILRIPIAGVAIVPEEVPADAHDTQPLDLPEAPPVPAPPAPSLLSRLRLRFHPLVFLAIPVGLLLMGVATWMVWQTEQAPVGEGAKRPPRRRDEAIRYENMDPGQVKLLEGKEREDLLACIDKAADDGNWERLLNLSGKALAAGFGDAGTLWLRCGQAYATMEKEKEAIAAYRQAIAAGVQNVSAMLLVARANLVEKRLDAAVSVLRAAAVAFPDDKEVRLLTGEACLALGDEDGALVAWRNLSEIDFPDDLLRLHLQLLRRKNETSESYRFFLYAARKFHDYRDFLTAAECAPDLDQRLFVLAEAASFFRENPERDRLALLRAETMLAAGKKEEAAILLKSLRLGDQSPEFLPRLAELTARAGTMDGLRDVWMEIRHLYPSDIALHEKLVKMLIETGGRQQARNLYGRWVTEEPRSPLPNYIFGLLVEDDDLALSSLDQALSLKPDFHEAAFAAAELCRRRGEHSRAERYYQTTLRLRPVHREARYGLALNNISRDGTSALRAYEEYLSRIGISRGEALPELLTLAQFLPTPAAAEALLAEMAEVPGMADLHRRQRIRTKLIYQQLTDQDFLGDDSPELREYHILYLLGKGRLRDVLLLPTPKEAFPEFWKVFLCWREGIDVWRGNAMQLRAKHPGDPFVEAATGLWLRTLTPEAAAAFLPRLSIDQKPILALMIAERYRSEGNRTKARIEYLRAARLAGVSPSTQVIRWFSEN